MLTLQNLKLDGFLSHDLTEISLDEEGITFIQGETGAGKSVIFEAIVYLLFGKTFRGVSSVKDLINKIKDFGYDISLEFSIDKNYYKIREVRGRQEDDLYFEINGDDSRKKTAPETRKFILKTIGISFQEFKNIAILGQKQTQILVDGTSGERGKFITEMFGLNSYDEHIDEVNKDLKACLSKKEALAARIEENKKDLESLKKSLIIEQIEEIDETKLVELNTKIAEVEEKLNKIRNKELCLKETIGKYSAIQKQKERIIQLNSELEVLNKKIESCEKIENVEGIKADLESWKDEKSRLSFAISKLSTELNNIKKMGNLCPINKKECPVNIPTNFKQEREDACNSDSREFQLKLNDATANLQKKETLIKKSNEYDLILSQIKNKKETINSLQIEETDIDIEKTKEDLNKYSNAIGVGKQKLSELQAEKNNINTKIRLREQKIELEKKLKAALDEKTKSIEQLEKDLESGSVEAQYLAETANVFKKTKLYKIDLVLEVLNENLSTILSRISDGTYKAMLTSQKENSTGKKTLDELNCIVSDSYKALPIESWSGGQTTQVGLALLLATWKTAYMLSGKNASFLWVDEPFESLSSGIVGNVLETLLDIGKELGANSIKVISHREIPENLFDHVWKVEMENGISRLEVL